MVDVFDFVRSYDDKVPTPEEYVNNMLDELSAPAAKAAVRDSVEWRKRAFAEYMEHFKRRFKDLIKTKELPS